MPYVYMLDTNAFSALISERARPARERFLLADLRQLCISSITRGEIEFGLAQQPEATRKGRMAAQIFHEIDTLPWSTETALVYGKLRASLAGKGKPLGPLDMLIAAHALSLGATLVSSDRAFRMVPDLRVEDWMTT
jgi:tRNA(fMet)-specific endonuclease VapC